MSHYVLIYWLNLLCFSALFGYVLLDKDTAIFNSEKDFLFILEDEPSFVRKEAIAFYNLASRTIFLLYFLFL